MLVLAWVQRSPFLHDACRIAAHFLLHDRQAVLCPVLPLSEFIRKRAPGLIVCLALQQEQQRSNAHYIAYHTLPPAVPALLHRAHMWWLVYLYVTPSCFAAAAPAVDCTS